MKIPRAPSQAEETFALQLKASKIPFEREVRFHPTRRWRTDFVIPAADQFMRPIAIEIDGILKQGGGAHQTYAGITNQCEKRNELVLAGYVVLVVTPKQVKAGAALSWVQRALGEDKT